MTPRGGHLHDWEEIINSCSGWWSADWVCLPHMSIAAIDSLRFEFHSQVISPGGLFGWCGSRSRGWSWCQRGSISWCGKNKTPMICWRFTCLFHFHQSHDKTSSISSISPSSIESHIIISSLAFTVIVSLNTFFFYIYSEKYWQENKKNILIYSPRKKRHLCTHYKHDLSSLEPMSFPLVSYCYQSLFSFSCLISN